MFFPTQYNEHFSLFHCAFCLNINWHINTFIIHTESDNVKVCVFIACVSSLPLSVYLFRFVKHNHLTVALALVLPTKYDKQIIFNLVYLIALCTLSDYTSFTWFLSLIHLAWDSCKKWEYSPLLSHILCLNPVSTFIDHW